jgi:hypothetical protein
LPVPGAGFTFSTPVAALFEEAVVVPDVFDNDEELDVEEEFDEPFAVSELLLMSVQQVSDSAAVRHRNAAGSFLLDMKFTFLSSRDGCGIVANLKIKLSA